MIVPVRFSYLKRMAESPAHYRHALTDPKDNAAMRRGRALHSYVLGSEDAVVLYPGKVRAGKEWEAFRDAHPDDDILIASELDDANGMRASLKAHHPAQGPSAMELLTSGRRERRIAWEMLGRACSGTPDVAGDIVVDLKSTRCARPEFFVREARRMHYHAQLAWYQDGLDKVGKRPTAAWIVAVESKPPYVVQCFNLSERALEEGRRSWRLWLEQLIACEQADYWRGYLDGPADFDVETDYEITIGGKSVEVAADEETEEPATTGEETPWKG